MPAFCIQMCLLRGECSFIHSFMHACMHFIYLFIHPFPTCWKLQVSFPEYIQSWTAPYVGSCLGSELIVQCKGLLCSMSAYSCIPCIMQVNRPGHTNLSTSTHIHTLLSGCCCWYQGLSVWTATQSWAAAAAAKPWSWMQSHLSTPQSQPVAIWQSLAWPPFRVSFDAMCSARPTCYLPLYCHYLANTVKYYISCVTMWELHRLQSCQQLMPAFCLQLWLLHCECSFIHSIICSFIHSVIHSCIHSPIHAFMHPPSIHLSRYPPIHPSIHPLAELFIHPFMHTERCRCLSLSMHNPE